MTLLSLAPLLVALQLQATTVKVAMMPLGPSEGVNDNAAAVLTDAVVAEIRRLPGTSVITQQEIASLLSLEKQKAALGCADDSCLAEIGGALGVDRMVTGSVARLGESWLVGLKLLDVKRARTLAHADRRFRGGTIDDVLDALGPMVAELFGAREAVPAARSTGAAAKAEPAQAIPAGWIEQEIDLGEKRAKLRFVTDGQGRYIAWDPAARSFEPFYAGDGERFFEQRVIGGSRNGEKSFDLYFWEPRYKGGGRASFGMSDGAFSLTCVREKPVSLKPVEGKEAEKLRNARFHSPRWQRQAWALARDDEGNYYYVDRAREPRDNRDFRLFVGPRGKLRYQPLKDAIVDGSGELFLAETGKLKFGTKDGKPFAEWLRGPTRTALTHLDIESNAPFAYGDLGAYAGESLGTPCDGRF